MPTDLRIVFDTNVIVSALLIKDSVARQAFDRALELGKLIISQATVEEVNGVLRRPGFEKYLSEEERLEFITALVREAVLVEVIEKLDVCRDPQDNKFLEAAIAGRAHCIVSGDKDLLVLHPFREISIVSPRAFLDYSLKEPRQIHEKRG
jgi:uncharacterized protein